MQCDLCDAEVRDVEAAIEAGWSPSYYERWADKYEITQPICLRCSSDKCCVVDGELVLKPVAVRPVELMSYGWDDAIHDHRLR